MMHRSWRHLLLPVSLSLLAIVARVPSVPLAASPPPFDWQQFKGTTLRVLLSKSPWQQVMAPHFPEFEQLTGIRLQTEVYPQSQLWDTLEKGLREPGRVDVFMTWPGLDGLHFLRTGGFRPVNDYLKDSRLTARDYDWEDFLPRTRAAMEIEGTLLGPPIMAEHLALLYRKDVFKKYDVGVPRTLDELEAAARFLHKQPMGPKGERGVGVVSRGQGAMATSLYAGIIHALGGSWLDGRQRPTIDGGHGLAALQYLGRLLGSYAPPDISSFDWQEASKWFQEGRAAMYIEGSSIYPLIEQPETSSVAGQVGYALFPAGPGGSGATIPVKGLAIARGSAHPEAAWLFLQWASGKEMVKQVLQRGVLVGRESAWRDGSVSLKVPADLAQSFREAGRIGVVEWAPPMVAVTSAREAVGAAINAAVRGEDIRAAATAASLRLTEIWNMTEVKAGQPARPAP
ncbi:MAG TPA: sugar ABC transporter substrate-binding protein [Candidatus Methylomirabilis sp.]|nr:sugar ABC transporter substrate-binding protein [Candidatus Methylomirabilis sp.]